MSILPVSGINTYHWYLHAFAGYIALHALCKTGREDMRYEQVNHPSHYAGEGYTALDVICDYGLGFLAGNVVKYAIRAGKKPFTPMLTDINKALWYAKYLAEKEGEWIYTEQLDSDEITEVLSRFRLSPSIHSALTHLFMHEFQSCVEELERARENVQADDLEGLGRRTSGS